MDRRAEKLKKDKAATAEEKSAIAKLQAAFDEGKAARQVDLRDADPDPDPHPHPHPHPNPNPDPNQVVAWHRIKDFQLLSLRLICSRILHTPPY